MPRTTPAFDVVEAGIARLRHALETGEVTAEGLLEAYLARLDAYDAPGTATALNAVPVRNPDAPAEARASDERRRRGAALGPLDGIPYTAKASFSVRGLPCTAGSPAFAGLTARRDAFAVERFRAAGAICLGLTTMPPMACGGMQRGLYGRAESPYSAAHLTAPFASGSSNGSGTATAASFAAFGLAEETWSSGRGPASYNALCAYTPSRGVISVRGNWPLVPTMDVVVPHARTMADLLAVLDALVADDPAPTGDLWRTQPWVAIPPASAVRPASYAALAPRSADDARAVLRGRRIGVPRMYVGTDPDQGTGTGLYGGPAGTRIETAPAVLELWDALRRDLQLAGAELVPTDLPAVSNYEGDRPGAPTIRTRGLVPPEFLDREVLDLAALAWEDFLALNGDAHLDTLAVVDGAAIFPPPPGALTGHSSGFPDDIALYPGWIRAHPGATWDRVLLLEEGLRGLEETRRRDVDGWLDALRLDAIAFPAVADVAAADADVDPAAAAHAWRNGVWVANGNVAVRHLGVPTVTVPMGLTADAGMPVGVTLAGRAYDDTALLRLGAAIEATRPRRREPPRTPRLR